MSKWLSLSKNQSANLPLLIKSAFSQENRTIYSQKVTLQIKDLSNISRGEHEKTTFSFLFVTLAHFYVCEAQFAPCVERINRKKEGTLIHVHATRSRFFRGAPLSHLAWIMGERLLAGLFTLEVPVDARLSSVAYVVHLAPSYLHLLRYGDLRICYGNICYTIFGYDLSTFYLVLFFKYLNTN